MGNGSVFSRFVLSLKVGYRTLQPLQEPLQSLGVVAPVQRGVGSPSYHPPPEPPGPPTSSSLPYAPYARTASAWPADALCRTSTGCCGPDAATRSPQVRYLVPAGRLELAARAHPGHEAVQPHAQQRTWMVGWRSQHLPVYLHPKLPPVLPVQSVNELGHESRRMVQRQQFVKRRRQHPYLLSAHLSKRHLNLSPIDVASKVHLTTSHCQFGLLGLR